MAAFVGAVDGGASRRIAPVLSSAAAAPIGDESEEVILLRRAVADQGREMARMEVCVPLQLSQQSSSAVTVSLPVLLFPCAGKAQGLSKAVPTHGCSRRGLEQSPGSGECACVCRVNVSVRVSATWTTFQLGTAGSSFFCDDVWQGHGSVATAVPADTSTCCPSKSARIRKQQQLIEEKNELLAHMKQVRVVSVSVS